MATRVQPEALRDPLPDGGALEEVKRPGAAGDRVHGPRREHLDAGDGALDAAARGGPSTWLASRSDGDRQRDVGLDGGDDVGRRRLAVLEQPQDAVARLDQHREGLERLEGRRQPAAVALVVVALARGVRVSRRQRSSEQRLPPGSSSLRYPVRARRIAAIGLLPSICPSIGR